MRRESHNPLLLLLGAFPFLLFGCVFLIARFVAPHLGHPATVVATAWLLPMLASNVVVRLGLVWELAIAGRARGAPRGLIVTAGIVEFAAGALLLVGVPLVAGRAAVLAVEGHGWLWIVVVLAYGVWLCKVGTALRRGIEELRALRAAPASGGAPTTPER